MWNFLLCFYCYCCLVLFSLFWSTNASNIPVYSVITTLFITKAPLLLTLSCDRTVSTTFKRKAIIQKPWGFSWASSLDFHSFCKKINAHSQNFFLLLNMLTWVTFLSSWDGQLSSQYRGNTSFYYSTIAPVYHIWSRERANYETVIHCSVLDRPV